MVIRYQVRDMIDVNCYLYVDEESGHCFLIDPGAQGEELLSQIRERGWTIEKILLTHGHFDHIGGLAVLGEREGIPVWIHEAGEAWLTDPVLNLSAEFPKQITYHGANHFRDGDVFQLESDPSWALRVISTPGHTPDSVVLYDEKRGIAFTGDTIFKDGRGNDAFPGGDGALMVRSIRERIMTLPGETVLYPGHGEETTVAEEKKYYRT